MDDVLLGWGEIAKYLRRDPSTAQRYERTGGLPVHRTPGGGQKAPVFALKPELDDWLGINRVESNNQATDQQATRSGELAAPVLNRIFGIGQETKLYRRNYVLHFDLKWSGKLLQANVEYKFELCNATDRKQSYVQEFTVDDSDRGYVESMSFSIDGRSAYQLKRPSPTKKHLGYVVYRGPKQSIAPGGTGRKYVYTASWVIHRSESDIWYNHMVLPTVGVKIETHAPTAFEITPSFSKQELVMKGEHIDIAWHKRP